MYEHTIKIRSDKPILNILPEPREFEIISIEVKKIEENIANNGDSVTIYPSPLPRFGDSGTKSPYFYNEGNLCVNN